MSEILTPKSFNEIINLANTDSYPSVYKKFNEGEVSYHNYIVQADMNVYKNRIYDDITLQFDGNDGYANLPSMTSNPNFDITVYYYKTNSSTLRYLLNYTTGGNGKISLYQNTNLNFYIQNTAGATLTLTGSTTHSTFNKIRIKREGVYYGLYIDDVLQGSITSLVGTICTTATIGYMGYDGTTNYMLANECLKSMTGSIIWNKTYTDMSLLIGAVPPTDKIAGITNRGRLAGTILQSLTANQSTLTAATTAFEYSVELVQSLQDKTTDIAYYLRYLQRVIDVDDAAFNDLYLYASGAYSGFPYGDELWGDPGPNKTVDLNEYDNLFILSIYKRHYGDYISDVTKCTINDNVFITAELFNKSNNRWLGIKFLDPGYYCLLDLECGLLYIFTQATSIDTYDIRYNSNQLRKEIDINCNVLPQEFNLSTNSSAYDQSTLTSVTSANTYIDRFSVQDELLKNGNLELGNTTNWTGNYCSISAVTDLVYADVYSLKTTFDDSSVINSEIYNTVDLRNYDVSISSILKADFYFQRGTITANKIFQFHVEQYNGSSYVSITSKNISITAVPFNEWYRVILYCPIQYIHNTRIKIIIQDNPTDSTYFYLDNVSLKLTKSSVNANRTYITSIGLYNHLSELLMTAKFTKPIKKSTLPMNIKIRTDLV